METITKWKAKDGAEFASMAECVAREALIDEVDVIMANLPKRPDGCDFSNGHGYVQHNAETFWPAREVLLRVANRLYPHAWLTKSIEDRTVHPSCADRVIGDALPRPLATAWYRFVCTDDSLREWGQPYFREHPSEAPGQQEVPVG